MGSRSVIFMRKIEEKIKEKQGNILTNVDLSSYGYVKSGKSNGIQNWRLREIDYKYDRKYYGPLKIVKSLEKKIESKQKYILSNEDLSKYGYIKFDTENKVCWKLKSADCNSDRIRDADRHWFIEHLGKKYMLQFDIHHDWYNGGICYLLTKLQHIKLHKELKSKHNVK